MDTRKPLPVAVAEELVEKMSVQRHPTTRPVSPQSVGSVERVTELRRVYVQGEVAR